MSNEGLSQVSKGLAGFQPANNPTKLYTTVFCYFYTYLLYFFPFKILLLYQYFAGSRENAALMQTLTEPEMDSSRSPSSADCIRVSEISTIAKFG